MSQNVDRVSANLRKMIEAGAPESDITTYLAQEGFNRDSFVRAVDLSKKAGGKKAEFGVGRALAQGLTFGAADELEALMRSIAGSGTYEQNLAALNIAKQQYEQESPKTAMAAQLIGGLPYAFVPFLGQARLAQIAKEAPKMGRAAINVGQSVAAGTTAGALTAAGEADPGARLASAGTGALTGGAVGVAAPVVGKAVGAAGGKIVDVTTGIPGVEQVGKLVGAATGQTIDAAKRAQEKLLEAIYRDELTPRKVSGKSSAPALLRSLLALWMLLVRMFGLLVISRRSTPEHHSSLSAESFRNAQLDNQSASRLISTSILPNFKIRLSSRRRLLLGKRRLRLRCIKLHTSSEKSRILLF